MSDQSPPIHSYHEYTQYLEEALSFVRCLQHLSRKHSYLVSLDKQMSRCWNTSVNCNVPDAYDREACAKSIGAVSPDDLRGPIMPAMRALVPLAQHCQKYFVELPLPPGATPVFPVTCMVALCRCENTPGSKYCRRCGAILPIVPQPRNSGWALPSNMVHGEEIVADLTVCIDDIRCLQRLSPDSELFNLMWDQIQKLARFSRESLLPTAGERAELVLDRISTDDMESHVEAMFISATKKLHFYSQLYVNFPTTL